MENTPNYIGILFGVTTLITIGLFYYASHKSRITLFLLLGWTVLQSVIAASGFYTVTHTIPPRFLLLVLPPFLLIALLFATAKGRRYIDALDLRYLTWLHTIRIPVEIVLFLLYVNHTIPELMTFEGRNFDILSGITAPLVYFLFIRKKVQRRSLLIWNFICLGLLINIVTHAILSAPFPFQQLAFDQPNIAVLHFPFVWLPCCVVPLVLFSHLAAIRQLTRKIS